MLQWLTTPSSSASSGCLKINTLVDPAGRGSSTAAPSWVPSWSASTRLHGGAVRTPEPEEPLGRRAVGAFGDGSHSAPFCWLDAAERSSAGGVALRRDGPHRSVHGGDQKRSGRDADRARHFLLLASWEPPAAGAATLRALGASLESHRRRHQSAVDVCGRHSHSVLRQHAKRT